MPMFKIGDHKYKICLLDTNAVSYILRKEKRFVKFFNLYPFPEYIYAFSTYVIYEIYKDKNLFGKFKNKFASLPNMLLKNERDIFNEEVKKEINSNYEIIPWLLNLSAITGVAKNKNPLDVLFNVLNLDERFIRIENTLNESYGILSEWAEWAKKYPQKGKIIQFRTIEAFCVSQIANYDSTVITRKQKNIKFMDYASIRVLGYAWYYKFVSDTARKTSLNDLVDIFNISALPYCDLYIGENNMVDIVNKMKQKNIIQADLGTLKASQLLD